MDHMYKVYLNIGKAGYSKGRLLGIVRYHPLQMPFKPVKGILVASAIITGPSGEQYIERTSA